MYSLRIGWKALFCKVTDHAVTSRKCNGSVHIDAVLQLLKVFIVRYLWFSRRCALCFSKPVGENHHCTRTDVFTKTFDAVPRTVFREICQARRQKPPISTWFDGYQNVCQNKGQTA
jgi:hypothetical protein